MQSNDIENTLPSLFDSGSAYASKRISLPWNPAGDSPSDHLSRVKSLGANFGLFKSDDVNLVDCVQAVLAVGDDESSRAAAKAVEQYLRTAFDQASSLDVSSIAVGPSEPRETHIASLFADSKLLFDILRRAYVLNDYTRMRPTNLIPTIGFLTTLTAATASMLLEKVSSFAVDAQLPAKTNPEPGKAVQPEAVPMSGASIADGTSAMEIDGESETADRPLDVVGEERPSRDRTARVDRAGWTGEAMELDSPDMPSPSKQDPPSHKLDTTSLSAEAASSVKLAPQTTSKAIELEKKELVDRAAEALSCANLSGKIAARTAIALAEILNESMSNMGDEQAYISLGPSLAVAPAAVAKLLSQVGLGLSSRLRSQALMFLHSTVCRNFRRGDAKVVSAEQGDVGQQDPQEKVVGLKKASVMTDNGAEKSDIDDGDVDMAAPDSAAHDESNLKAYNRSWEALQNRGWAVQAIRALALQVGADFDVVPDSAHAIKASIGVGKFANVKEYVFTLEELVTNGAMTRFNDWGQRRNDGRKKSKLSAKMLRKSIKKHRLDTR